MGLRLPHGEETGQLHLGNAPVHTDSDAVPQVPVTKTDTVPE